MNNKTKEIDIKYCLCFCIFYFFDDMIKIKNLDSNKIKVNGILINYIGYVTVKNLSYAKINSLNPSYLIIDKLNGYIEEENIENKHLRPVSIDESKDTLKKYEELLDKIRDTITNSENYD